MRCLVTGSSGFIGSHLVEALLNRGYDVEGLDKVKSRYSNIHTNRIDLSNPKGVKKVALGFDFVFHLAGLLGTHELIDDNQSAIAVNIGGTVNILEACRRSGSKLILASKPNCWSNTYSITKIAAENFVQMYRQEYGVQAAIMKWFNVYGSRQPLFNECGYKKFIPHAIDSALKGEDIEIYGTGTQTMDLIHTADTVQAVLQVMDNWSKCEGKTFEVGHHVVSVNEAAKKICSLTNSKSNLVYVPMRRGEPLSDGVEANTSLLRHSTNWNPQMSLEAGLIGTINWYNGSPVE